MAALNRSRGTSTGVVALIQAVAFALRSLGGLTQRDYCSVETWGLLLMAICRLIIERQAHALYCCSLSFRPSTSYWWMIFGKKLGENCLIRAVKGSSLPNYSNGARELSQYWLLVFDLLRVISPPDYSTRKFSKQEATSLYFRRGRHPWRRQLLSLQN